MLEKIYLATRKSPLALWQANETQRLLSEQNILSELILVVTTGDKIQNTNLASVNLTNEEKNHLATGKGLFIKEIQEALLDKKGHIAVHSMKDLPISQTPGLTIAALLPRASPCDVIILSPDLLNELKLEKSLSQISFDELKKILLKSKLFLSKTIGTTSTRRQLLMKKLFSHNINLENLRGNVDTRLKRVQNNEFSAILLAKAGLERLGLFNSKSMFCLPTNIFIPATAQGVVALECAENNAELIQTLSKLNCKQTTLSAALERMILFFLEGDCHSSIGIHHIEKTIHVIYGKGDHEKQISISLLPQDFEEINNCFNSTNTTFSGFYNNLISTNVAQNIKNQLGAVLV